MKSKATNQASVKRADSKLSVDKMQSIDKLSLLLGSAEKLGLPQRSNKKIVRSRK